VFKSTHFNKYPCVSSPHIVEYMLVYIMGMIYVRFQMMRNHESPVVPFTVLRTRFPDTFIVFTSYGIGDNPRQKIGLTRRSNTNHAAYISILRLSKYICVIGIPINQLTSKLLRH